MNKTKLFKILLGATAAVLIGVFIARLIEGTPNALSAICLLGGIGLTIAAFVTKPKEDKPTSRTIAAVGAIAAAGLMLLSFQVGRNSMKKDISRGVDNTNPTEHAYTSETKAPEATLDVVSDRTQDATQEPTGAVTEETTVEPTEVQTDEPTEEPTEEPTPTPTPTPAPTKTPKPTATPTPKPTATPTPKPTKTPKPTATPTPEPSWYKSGMYKVGDDIPAGEYFLKSTSDWGMYFEICSDSSGSFDSIIANGNYNTFCYVTVKKGEYLTVERGKFIEAEDAPKNLVKNGVAGEGMYKVGRDIPAGEYKIECDSDYGAYYEVCSNSRHILDSIVSNDFFSSGSRYVTVKKGQYLIITGGHTKVK